LSIPQSCKRLAEVDFPIATVSKHAAREKSIRHGHPSTLHLWWARRPLASCRAILLGLLLPDPCDALCPDDFKTQARDLLPRVQGIVGPSDLDLRRAMLKFIGDFANWDYASNAKYLEVGRGLVKAAHPEETPLVVDPFAGGGSIPLEALRLGCEAFASDLNPVAGLILKVMLEDIPRHGPELADELRRVGAEVKAAAEKELAEFYPPDPDGAKPIAYLWARTVRCESPNCGAEIPLMRSFWLSKKASRKKALRPKVIRKKGETPRVEFEIFRPTKDSDVPTGTVARAKATCLCCGAVLPPERVRAQLREQRGGADVIFDKHGHRTGGARLLAVVTLHPSPTGGRGVGGEGGRHYRLPTDRDYQAIWHATKRLQQVAAHPLPNGLSAVPDEPLPPQGTLGFRIRLYGMERWGDLFVTRQKLTMIDLAKRVMEFPQLQKPLALALTKLSSGFSSLSVWRSSTQDVGNMFERIGLAMCWDFAEVSPFAGATRGWGAAIDNTVAVAERINVAASGSVDLADASDHPLPSESCQVWFTDPPYYDAVPYSDLSDFYFVWHKRVLDEHSLVRDPFDPSNPLTPKAREAVQDETKQVDGRPKDRTFFEQTMAKAFAEGRRVLREDGIGCVVFAHKTTEGWEALLSGMIRGGWVITGSWPIATEMANRLRARESAALAGSVHLICRPRTEDAIGDWSDVLRELPRRVADWMERLQAEGVRGADLVFACIGPALEIYSRYSKVVDAEDREIPLGGDPEAKEPYKRGYLAYVWEVVARAALEQVLGTAEAKARNGASGALEEDARLTALFLWTLQSTNGQEAREAGKMQEAESDEETPEEETDEEGAPRKKAKGFSLVFDVARRFAQPLGIHLDEWEGRIIEMDKGIVRLLAVTERADQLFGTEGAGAVATELEHSPQAAAQLQMALFPQEQSDMPKIRGRGKRKTAEAGAPVSDETLKTHREATTLDRVHAAMLLQQSGRANALRALLKAEQERGPNFLRLANSLSALYPRESEEKRLLDAMLLAVPR
jgi:putative DNA methylase